MRILFIVHQFYPEFSGGTERVTLGLAKLAQRAGHFVRILTTIAPELDETVWQEGCSPRLPESAIQGIPVTGIRRSELGQDADYSLEFEEPLVVEICRLLERDRFDVCHVMHSMRMSSAIQAVQNHEIPYILTLTDFFLPCYRINLVNRHGEVCEGARGGKTCGRDCLVPEWDPESLVRRNLVSRKILGLADYVVCPSDYVTNRLECEYPEISFRTIPHGLDPGSFRIRQPGREEVREEITIGYLGSMSPVKGVDVLVQAFSRVQSAKLRLALYGSFHDNFEYAARIRQLVEKDHRISLHDAVSREEVTEVLQSFDVVCIPSLVPETFSLVLHEACAVMVPAIVSSPGAPAQQIEASQCGAVVQAGDADGWVEVLEAVVAEPGILEDWRGKLPLPLRVEEEAFFYQTLYQRMRKKV